MFIVKIPGINGEGKTKGCERAGNAILEELKNIHSNESGNIIDTKLLDLEEIHLDNSNLELTNKLIYENSLEIFDEKPKVIFLGGDHSISYSIGKAFLEHCKNQRKKPCLIIFDAHADCMEPIEEPTNEEWLRKLIDDGFPSENVLIVGARNIHQDEIKFIKENKIKTLSMSALTEDLNDMCDTIMEFANGKELYISIDIDVIDPAFAPATAYPENGGLTSRQFVYLIQRMKRIKTLRAIDLVEINEKEDKKYNNMTVKLGAKILSELL
ncbi:MAG: arginase family protein [Candidatus Nanoarchaeia archaeon]|nr:arginase family protein [Candidatus Nanoarchaeia archaeon]MDD5358520.1 arginase family protein [Candidatus Nanoarchaeia archaeon]MDD5589034.1 arginase family protein [Candidatus Nanoarchaeia archaeon]